MHPIIDAQREKLDRVCRQFDVQRLELFGSATGDLFDVKRSDIDFIVDFGPGGQPDLFSRYFGLNEALTALFDRKVDLVMAGAMANPHFAASVNRTRQALYARPLAEAS